MRQAGEAVSLPLVLLSPHFHSWLLIVSAERCGQRAFWGHWPHTEHFGDSMTLFSHSGHN